MKTRGGGWTLIQHRSNGSVNFHRGWRDYKMVGFGGSVGLGCITVSIGSVDQNCGTGQEVPITIYGWFGTERRGSPTGLWSLVTCDCCIWPPSCSPPPSMLLHLLSLPLPVILPHTSCTSVTAEHYCLHASFRPHSFLAKGNEYGDESNNISKHKTQKTQLDLIQSHTRDCEVAPLLSQHQSHTFGFSGVWT